MPKKPPVPQAPTENDVELLVQELTNAPPEECRALVCALRDSVQAPGGRNVAWDVLRRTRKPGGKDAGITMLINLLAPLKTETSEGHGLDRSAIEPAAQLLALFCNFKPHAQAVAKQKKTMAAVIGVLGDWECSLASRISASWVLRRCTEFEHQSRLDVAQKDTLVLLTRVMMGDDLRPKEADVLEVGGSRSSTPTISRNPSATSGSLAHRPASSSTFGEGKPAQKLPKVTEIASPLASVPAGPPKSGGGPHGAAPARPITARSMSSQVSQSASRPSTAVSFPERPTTASNRPATAISYSRPGTGMRPATSQSIFSMSQIRPDTMCLEANCCAAVGNAALREDCIERLGKFNGVMLAIIYLLENGTVWAQGHAARTLGNLLPSAVNLKFLSQVDTRNTAASALYSMILNTETPLKDKEHALHAIGNMARSPTFCLVFNHLEGFLSALFELADQGISQEATERIIGCLSQQRLDTRTWRAPTRVYP